jgi:hypothetical protein
MTLLTRHQGYTEAYRGCKNFVAECNYTRQPCAGEVQGPVARPPGERHPHIIPLLLRHRGIPTRESLTVCP